MAKSKPEEQRCGGSRTQPDKRGATSAAGCPGCPDCSPEPSEETWTIQSRVERSRDEWRDAAFRWCHTREAERNLDGAEEHIKSLYADLAEVERERDDARAQRNHYDEMRQEAEQRTMREISRWETVEAERDEARAEVVRLREIAELVVAGKFKPALKKARAALAETEKE